MSKPKPENAAVGHAAPQSGTGHAAPQCGPDNNTSQDAPIGASRSLGWYSRGYLPHFDSSQVIQHISYRLADSLPRTVLEQMQAELQASGLDTQQRKAGLRRRVETYLDAGHGSCVLQVPEVATSVVDTWHRFDGERYRLLAWVVMPNHCHVLIKPFDDIPLGKIVLSWKNYTARFINEYKRRTGVRQSQGQVWQREYWDRFIRNERHFEAVIDYIVMNPVKAGLVAEAGDWPWSSASSGSETEGQFEGWK